MRRGLLCVRACSGPAGCACGVQWQGTGRRLGICCLPASVCLGGPMQPAWDGACASQGPPTLRAARPCAPCLRCTACRRRAALPAAVPEWPADGLLVAGAVEGAHEVLVGCVIGKRERQAMRRRSITEGTAVMRSITEGTADLSTRAGTCTDEGPRLIRAYKDGRQVSVPPSNLRRRPDGASQAPEQNQEIGGRRFNIAMEWRSMPLIRPGGSELRPRRPWQLIV